MKLFILRVKLKIHYKKKLTFFAVKTVRTFLTLFGVCFLKSRWFLRKLISKYRVCFKFNCLKILLKNLLDFTMHKTCTYSFERSLNDDKYFFWKLSD